jgi:hypothetical protein
MISYYLNFLNNVLTYLSGEIIYNIRYNIKFRPKNKSSKFLVCTDEVYKLNIAEKYMRERERVPSAQHDGLVQESLTQGG